LKHGTFIEYSRDEAMISEQEFFDGKKDGVFIKYYAHGKIKEEKAYEDNLLHGTWLAFDIFGVTTKKVEYFRGVIIPEKD
jgi:antitoxin component YwqK of YwqJK toxin-antitoxin module